MHNLKTSKWQVFSLGQGGTPHEILLQRFVLPKNILCAVKKLLSKKDKHAYRFPLVLAFVATPKKCIEGEATVI